MQNNGRIARGVPPTPSDIAHRAKESIHNRVIALENHVDELKRTCAYYQDLHEQHETRINELEARLKAVEESGGGSRRTTPDVRGAKIKEFLAENPKLVFTPLNIAQNIGYPTDNSFVAAYLKRLAANGKVRVVGSKTPMYGHLADPD